MMTFYKMVVTIEISHATACFQHNQGSRRIIPLTDKRFGPCIKTTISYITDCSRSRTVHANASHDSIKVINQMESRRFILIIIIR